MKPQNVLRLSSSLDVALLLFSVDQFCYVAADSRHVGDMKLFTTNAAVRFGLGISVVMAGFLFIPAMLLYPGRTTESETPGFAFFQRQTGFLIGAGWQVIDRGDEHHGFVGDGETYAVFQLTQAATDALLSEKPPWSDSWQSGPVPGEIGINCDFGADGVAFAGHAGEGGGYVGNPALTALLGSEHVRFDAKSRCCDARPWHNGHLLIIDPVNQKVWLAVWDF